MCIVHSITKGNTKQGTKDILRPISITQIESCFLTSMQVSKKYCEWSGKLLNKEYIVQTLVG